jgi:hypothetical protein
MRRNPADRLTVPRRERARPAAEINHASILAGACAAGADLMIMLPGHEEPHPG